MYYIVLLVARSGWRRPSAGVVQSLRYQREDDVVRGGALAQPLVDGPGQHGLPG